MNLRLQTLNLEFGSLVSQNARQSTSLTYTICEVRMITDATLPTGLAPTHLPAESPPIPISPKSPHHTLFVCSLCQYSATEPTRDGVSGGQHLLKQLQIELAAQDLHQTIHLQPVRCMAACGQSCNVTLAAPNKLTFILSGLSPETSATEIATFCRQYTTCEDGKVPYRQRSTAIHQATAFILPPLPIA